jgi:hypothetical protein
MDEDADNSLVYLPSFKNKSNNKIFAIFFQYIFALQFLKGVCFITFTFTKY